MPQIKCPDSDPRAIREQCDQAPKMQTAPKTGAVHCRISDWVFAVGLKADSGNVAVADLNLRIGHQPAFDGVQEAAEQGRRG